MPHSTINATPHAFTPQWEVHDAESVYDSGVSIEVHCHIFYCLEAIVRPVLTWKG